MELVTLEQIRAARELIRGVAVRTGLHRLEPEAIADAGLTTAAKVWLKLESEQPIGSFKLRGAYNKIASLTPDELRRGVITYSSGNHAQGVAFGARALGARAVVVMPENAPLIKREATLALGAEVVLVGPESSERLRVAEQLVAENGYAMVPPYDDEAIIAGQATCGLEIVEQLPEVELVLAPVSGGGLLSGIATAVKLVQPQTQVWGAEPELAGDAAESFRTGSVVEWPGALTTRTIADGLRTQSLGTRNFAHIRRYVDGIVTVTEQQILAVTRLLLRQGIATEPSGAVTLAALLFAGEKLPHASKIVAVVSGGNIDPALRERLLAERA